MKSSNKIFKNVFILLISMVFMSGCALRENVKVNLDAFTQNPESYEGKRVIITATLDDVLERYYAYKGKEIELTAPVGAYGSRGYWTWYLFLEQDEDKLRCYTHHYRLRPDNLAVNMLKRLDHQKGLITVTGILRQDGLDLETLSADGSFVRTDYMPTYPGYYYGYY